MPRVSLFGLPIQVASYEQALAHLLDAGARRQAKVVVTPNVNHVVRLDAQPAFRAEYVQADFVFADGMPVVWASRLLGKPLPERVTGADLFVSLCKAAAAQGRRVFVAGGRPGQEAALLAGFAHHYPGLKVQVVCPSMNFDPVGAEGLALVDRVNVCDPDIVFVCLGMPKQERWALAHAPTLKAGVVLCVGAAMEFALGQVQRAPLWMQRHGLEWFWRLISQPQKMWKRYLTEDPRFALLVWQQWWQSRGRRS